MDNPLGFVGNNENPVDSTMLGMPKPNNTQSNPPPQPQVNPQTADAAHHYSLGKAFRSLMGSEVSYSVDPQTGKLNTTEAEQKPGSLWRGILAGALLGGSVAAKSKAPGFVQGLAEGGGAVVDEKQKQDLIKREQARQQFEDQLKAKQANRLEKSFQTEETLKQAQIAFHNAQTLHENNLAQQEIFTYHKNVADLGKIQLQPFINANPDLIKFRDVPEVDMNEIIKNNPNASHLLWEPTGTRVVIGENGKPDVHMTYSAVDPQGTVKLTSDWLSTAKEAGLDQLYGKQWDVLKKDKEVSVQSYMAMNQKVQELTNTKSANSKRKTDEEKDAASVSLMKAQASHFRAEASKLISDEEDRKILEKAWDTYMSGGDISKLSPKARSALSKSLTDIIKTQVDELKALPKDPATNQIQDQDRAKELYQNAENYQKIVDRIYGIKNVSTPSPGSPTNSMIPVKVNGQIGAIPASKLDEFLAANPDAQHGDQVSKEEVRTAPMLAARSGKIVRFDVGSPPPLDSLTDKEQLLTDGKGNYIIRGVDFKNPQWKSVGVGTSEEPIIEQD